MPPKLTGIHLYPLYRAVLPTGNVPIPRDLKKMSALNRCELPYTGSVAHNLMCMAEGIDTNAHVFVKGEIKSKSNPKNSISLDRMKMKSFPDSTIWEWAGNHNPAFTHTNEEYEVSLNLVSAFSETSDPKNDTLIKQYQFTVKLLAALPPFDYSKPRVYPNILDIS